MAEYTVDEDGRFAAALKEASQKADDLRVPLILILDDWYDSEKDTFALASKGPYRDLNDLYKRTKARDAGFVYPILKRSGALERSVTQKGAPGSSFKVTKKNLAIGTKVPYGKFHQEGTASLPARPFLFVEGPFAVGSQRGRVDRWIKILEEYLDEELGSV